MPEPLPVIVNRSGGTASSLGDELEAALREAFAGQAIDLRLVEGGEVAGAVARYVGRPLVAVGGGTAPRARRRPRWPAAGPRN
jgi:hypothetical protein